MLALSFKSGYLRASSHRALVLKLDLLLALSLGSGQLPHSRAKAGLVSLEQPATALMC